MPPFPTLSLTPKFRLYISLGVIGLNLSALPAAFAQKWDAAMTQFAKADVLQPPAPNSVVFTGSSSIVKWKTLSRDFPGIPVINRGFGGSELSDSVAYFDQVVLRYHPKLVVLYAGDNDLGAGKTAETVAQEFEQFCAKLHATLPATPVIFISIKPSPSRWKLHTEMVKANALIAAYCAKDPRRIFVDIYAAMLGTDGQPRRELYLEDRLHLQPEGYEIWTKIIQPVVKQTWELTGGEGEKVTPAVAGKK